MGRIAVTASIFIDEDELIERFVRARGPGGQNVNKVASAVQLRFDVRASPSLPLFVREKILSLGDSRLTKAGEIVILADRYRTQEMNRKDALDRLFELIRTAARPSKRRVATKPTASSKRRRLEAKTRRGAVKRQRSGKVNLD